MGRAWAGHEPDMSRAWTGHARFTITDPDMGGETAEVEDMGGMLTRLTRGRPRAGKAYAKNTEEWQNIPALSQAIG